MQADHLIGQWVDHYHIQQYIAGGGMADVYLALDSNLERQVAIKVLKAGYSQDSSVTARFQREAKTIARLDHPNIVQIFTNGTTASGLPYLAMQYVQGGSLQEQLEALRRQVQRMAVDEVLRLMIQIGRALHKAHQAGVIHRDLKPSNILLQPDGTPMLSDLGIAAIQQATVTRLTSPDMVVGTPHYMSPEQAMGREVDGRSDIYSFGIILYEMLSGALPFGGDSPLAILHQHVYQEPPALMLNRPDLPPAVVWLVAKCLRKEPEARYQTAGELITALQTALEPEQRPTASPFSAAPSPPPTKTGSKRGGALALIPLALLLIAFIAYQLFWPDEQEQPTADNRANPAAILPEETRPMTAAVDSLIGLDITVEPTIEPTTEPTTAASQSPTPVATNTPITSTTLVQTGGNTQVELSGTGVVRMTDDAANEFTPILSPDQSTLLFTSDRTANWRIYTMPAGGGNWNLLSDNGASNYHPHFSPDGRLITFSTNTSGDFEIYVMDSDGTNWQPLTSRAGDDVYPSFSPDGEWVLYMSAGDNGWGIYASRQDGSEQRAVIDTEADETFATFSPDGETVAFQSNESGNHEIHLIPWDGGSSRRVTNSSGRDANPVFSPDGRWIAFESNRDGNYEVYAVRADGGEVRNLTNHPGRDQLPAFSPDGKWILFQSDRNGSVDIYRQAIELAEE